MSVLSFLFGDKTNIRKEVLDLELDRLIWVEDDESWKGMYSGMKFLLASENGKNSPSQEISCISTIGGKMKVQALFMATLLACGVAVADETTQREKIAKIIEAQGLTLMFQQQMDASKEAAGEIGRDLAGKILKESGAPEGQQNPKVEQALRRYMERCATMISAKELVDTWATFYAFRYTQVRRGHEVSY